MKLIDTTFNHFHGVSMNSVVYTGIYRVMENNVVYRGGMRIVSDSMPFSTWWSLKGKNENQLVHWVLSAGIWWSSEQNLK